MDRLFNTKTGKVILSVIWGLGIAALFYKACEHAGCFVVNSSTTPDVENHIYEFKNECFGGNCPPVYPEVEQGYPSQCDQPLFASHSSAEWYEHRMPENGGDLRHSGESECYNFNPMDSIFRAPSAQIYHKYN